MKSRSLRPAARPAAKSQRPTFLLRLHAKDSPNGVTRKALRGVAKDLGMNENKLIHHAVRGLVRSYFGALPLHDIRITERDLKILKKRIFSI